jgi:phosphoenolpyruvate---glycerone phosphotransferase subunit DhaL
MTDVQPDAQHLAAQPPAPQSVDAEFARRWIAEFTSSFAEQAQLLSDLDRQAGDGDFGTNLTSALNRARTFIADLDPQTVDQVFDAVSKGFLNTGGTSGPLFGMWFREIAKSSRTDQEPVRFLAAGVSSGLAVIQRLGGASVGDNTMVDAIAPAADALAAASSKGTNLGSALLSAAEAAKAGARSTKDLIASRGRASYVGDIARGILDPGAVAVALFFASAAVAHGDARRDSDWLTD